MKRYRVKIEELNDGTKMYTPQVAKLIIKKGWIQRQRIEWYNIISSGYYGYQSSSSLKEYHNTEEKALQEIEGYKRQVEKDYDKQVKSTTYKNL